MVWWRGYAAGSVRGIHQGVWVLAYPLTVSSWVFKAGDKLIQIIADLSFWINKCIYSHVISCSGKPEIILGCSQSFCRFLQILYFLVLVAHVLSVPGVSGSLPNLSRV